MRFTAEARFGLGALLALQLATSSAGVALLGRMSPAVDRILRENVYSTEAVEHMLAELAAEGDGAAFGAALERARGNITEPEEQDILAAIDAVAPAALRGETDARAAVVAHLRELGAVNRASMRRADLSARLHGLAGAWAMALLGFVSFLVSLVVYRRLQRRLVAPIVEVDTVLADIRAGNQHRRASAPAEDPSQGRLVGNLNWLLDHRTAPQRQATNDPALREALLALLDRVEDRQVVVGDVAGRVVAVNQAALGSGRPRWTELAADVVAGTPPDRWTVTRLESGTWIAEGPPP